MKRTNLRSPRLLGAPAVAGDDLARRAYRHPFRLLSLLLAFCFFFSACGAQGSSSTSSDAQASAAVSDSAAASGAQAQPSDAASASSTPDPASSASPTPAPYTQLSVMDMAGRSNTIPAKVERIYCNNSAAALFVYAIAPEKLIGWCEPLSEQQKALLAPEYRALPSFGPADSADLDAVRKANPQICFFATVGIQPETKQNADLLQEKLGIPVLVMDSSLVKTGLSIGFLGAALEQSERGAVLSSYADTLLDTRKSLKPADKPVSLYFASGADALESKGADRPYAEVLQLLQLSDVSQLDSPGAGPSKVSLEQVSRWNPQIMLLAGDAATSPYAVAKKVLQDPAFSKIQAVQQKKVYAVPSLPFSWMDEPAGPNRLLGFQWLGHLLYPEVFPGDPKAQTKEFYKLFYHVDLTDDQVQSLLQP